jgi:hypothetical protein
MALTRVQFAGKSGEVVGTDGRQLLVQSGFELPWQESLLLPALPVYHAPELHESEELRVGRTDSHVSLVSGPWTVLLAIDDKGRFPDYRAVVPKAECVPSVLALDAGDVEFLLETMPRLPAEDENHAPITLDLGKQAVLRVSHAEQVTEVILVRSRVSGPTLRVVMQRRFLHRALKLHFNRIQVISRAVPLVCSDEKRTYLWMPLEGDPVPPSPEAIRLVSAATQQPAALSRRPPPRRREPMPQSNQPQPRPPRNGAGHGPQRLEPPPQAQATGDAPGLEELIAEVETIRSALGETQARLGRLIAALKQHRRRNRTVEAAIASLRELGRLGS